MNEPIPNNDVSSGYDNSSVLPNAATSLSPQTALHSALGQNQQQPTQAPAPQPAPMQPVQQAPQAQPTPAPVEASTTQNDPWSAFPDAPTQDTNADKTDPWAGFPDAKPQEQANTTENSRGAVKEWLKSVGKEDPNLPAISMIGMGKSALRGLAELMDARDTPSEKGLSPDALGVLALISPMSAASRAASPAIKQTEELLKDKGILPKSGGEISQNPDLQRMEEQAGANLRGTGAQEEALKFKTNKSEAMQDQVGLLGKVAEGANKADHMGNVANIIHDEAEQSGKGVDDAYDLARSLGKTNQVIVPTKDLQSNLGPALKTIETDHALDRGIDSTSKSILDALREKFMPDAEGKVAPPPDIEDLEAWRRIATGVRNSSDNKATRMAIGKMINSYDEYAQGLIKRVPENSESIQAYSNAVKLRAEHGARFENNDMLDNILHIGEKGYPKSIDDITNNMFGSGSIKGKQGMLDNYNAMIRAAGDKAPQVTQHLQNGYAQKIFENSIDGRLPGSNNPNISPAKLKIQLENMFVNQRELATQLYGQDAVDHANNLIKELALSVKQPKVANPSGTAWGLAHLAKADKALGAMSLVPGFGGLAKVGKFISGAAKGIAKGGIEAKQAEEAATTFSGNIPDRFKPSSKAAQKPKNGLLNKAGNKAFTGLGASQNNED